MNEQVFHFMSMPQKKKKSSAWYLTSGVSKSDYKAIYQAKGAASYEASLINIATPGTNDLTTESAPTWDAVNGWKFDGISQYLNTGEMSRNEKISVFLKYSGLIIPEYGTEYSYYLFGYEDDETDIIVYLFGYYEETIYYQMVYIGSGGQAKIITSLPSNAILCVSQGGFAINGEFQSYDIHDPIEFEINSPIYLGANTYAGLVPMNFTPYKTQLFAVHDNGTTALTSTQIAAISAQMAAV